MRDGMSGARFPQLSRPGVGRLSLRKACALLGSATAVLLTPGAARAQWVPYQLTGSLSNTGGFVPEQAAGNAGGMSSNGVDTIGHYNAGPTNYGGIGTGGDVTSYFIWTGTGTPTPLYVKVTAGATAHSAPPSATCSASDGLGDAMVTESDEYNGQRVSSHGSHLFQKAAPQGGGYGTILSLDPFTLSAQSSDGGEVSVSLSVATDTRAVAISSGIETSYYKTEEGDSGVVQGVHTRNPDGSIAVDSVVAWQDETLYTARGWAVNDLPLAANAAGFSEPGYAWTVTGEGWLTVPTVNPTHFSLLESDGSGFPKQTTVKVNVTDSDGAIGTNTYDITWHLPYEETDAIGSIDGSSVFETRCSDADPSVGVFVPLSHAGTLPFEALLDGASEIAALAGQEEAAGILKIIGAIAGIAEPWSKDYEEEHEFTGAINGSDSWTAANAEDAAHSGTDFVRHVPDNVNNWTDATMSLCRVKYYTISSWHADQYDTHGYNSPGHIIQTTKITSTHDEPVFTKIVY